MTTPDWPDPYRQAWVGRPIRGLYPRRSRTPLARVWRLLTAKYRRLFAGWE